MLKVLFGACGIPRGIRLSGPAVWNSRVIPRLRNEHVKKWPWGFRGGASLQMTRVSGGEFQADDEVIKSALQNLWEPVDIRAMHLTIKTC